MYPLGTDEESVALQTALAVSTTKLPKQPSRQPLKLLINV